ncbi:MAG: cupin domain-containing protein [bacterium]|nr:MAG: cupin domain-containing protein [bacterium]
MKITRLENCEKKAVELEGASGAFRQVPIGRADGAPNFSIRVFTLEPGGHTPHHSHESEHLNYVLSGVGVALEGETARKIRQGDFILVQPREVHQYRNEGDEPLVFMCMVPSRYE